MTLREDTDGFRRHLITGAIVSGCLLLIGTLFTVVAWFLAQIYLVTMPVLVALLLSTAVIPLVRWLYRHGVPKSMAALLVVLSVLGLWVLFGVHYAPAASNQMAELVGQVQEGAKSLRDWAVDVLPIRPTQLDQILSLNWSRSADFGRNVLSGARTVLELVIGSILVLVLVFFFARDGDRMFRWLVELAPRSARADVEAVSLAGWETLGRYLRGSALVAFADALGIGIGLLIIGVPLALPLAILTFFAGFFPIVGAVTAGLAAVLIAFASGGPTDAWLTLAVVVGVQQLESNVLAPVVLGRAVPLHPVVVLLSITAGSLLGGVAGAFLAVPAGAVAMSVLREVRARVRTRANGVQDAPGALS